jgi:putative ABC transport system permease protein
MPVRLILRHVLSHPLRSFLTAGSVFVAVFLLCFLRATTAALTSSVEQASTNRLWAQSAVSLFVDLPLAYQSKIATVDGVEHICRWQWFGGVYRDESNFFAQFGVDADTFFISYPELEIVDGSYEEFAKLRTACVVGVDLASKYGWKIGDTVPIEGRIFPRSDGTSWDFTIKAIYRSKTTNIDQNTMYFHYDYLRESLEAGEAVGPTGVGVYMVKVADGAPVERVMSDIDALFANGPQRVQTTTEGEFQRSFIAMLGNVPTLLAMIGGAVLFAIFFAVLNTMLMAARERVRTIGILKALGFTDGTVAATLVAESVLVCGTAGLLALGFTIAIREQLARFLINSVGIPGFDIEGPTIWLGIGLSLGLGVIAGLVPGIGARRLVPIRALRMEA